MQPPPPSEHRRRDEEHLQRHVSVEPGAEEHIGKQPAVDDGRPPHVNAVAAGKKDRRGIEGIRRDFDGVHERSRSRSFN
jgi:hypothetical protein